MKNKHEEKKYGYYVAPDPKPRRGDMTKNVYTDQLL